MNEDSFQYALENTRIILAPEQRIETFGNTCFRFHLITELMDHVDRVRIRDGKLHAERPQILAPRHYSRLLLEGFGEKAREYVDWLERHPEAGTFLKYGFAFRKTHISERVVQSSAEEVIDRVRDQVEREQEPLSAIIQGVDDGWEVCLLKFAVDIIQRSAGGNLGDLRNRGLL